ncbi:MAG: cytochrome c [Sphingomonadales bacterium]
MTRWILFILAILASFGVVFFLMNQSDETLTNLNPNNPEIVTRGKDIYAQECAACHGAQLEGQPNWRRRLPSGRLPAPPHDMTGHTWHHPDELLIQITKFGPGFTAGPDYQSDMPAYDGVLSDEEIVAVLSYIKSTWPAAIQQKHDVINQRYTSSKP